MLSARMKRKYNINDNDYEALYNQQQGLCAICKHPPSLFRGQPGHLVIDHDHSTRKVRGLLCMRCNSIVGKIETGCGYFKSRRYSYEFYQLVQQYLSK